jgi:hypothetical protein
MLLISCKSAINEGIVDDIDSNLAYIKIPLKQYQPSNQIKRSIIIDEEEQYSYEDMFELCTYFAAYFKRSSGEKYNTTANLDDDYLEIQIPKGTYNIVLLAGVETYTNSGYGYLYASGYVSNKEIISGTNTVNIVLKSIDISISSPTQVEVGEEFVAYQEFNLKNPYIEHGTHYFYIEPTNDYFDTFVSYGSGTINGTSITIVAPTTASVATIQLRTGIIDPLSFYTGLGSGWHIPIIKKEINFFDGTPPIVNITIEWGNE